MKIIENLKGRNREDLEIIIRAKNVFEANGYTFDKEEKHFEEVVVEIENKLKKEFGKEIKIREDLHRYLLSNKPKRKVQPHLGTIEVNKALTHSEAKNDWSNLFTKPELQTFARDKKMSELIAKYPNKAVLLVEFSSRGFLPKPPIRYLYCKKCGTTTNFPRGTPALDTFNCKNCDAKYDWIKATDRFYDEKNS